MQRKIIGLAAAVMWLTIQIPLLAQDLPGVRFLGVGEEGGDEGLARLVVGGSADVGSADVGSADVDPAPVPEDACLTWTWKRPSSESDIYPGTRAGSLNQVDLTWSLKADGSVVTPAGCASTVASFPELGIGPMGEIWFLNSTGETSVDAWADLLHAVEAAYWQSADRAETPFAEIVMGHLGDCEVRSFPVDRSSDEDRWAPIDLASVRVGRFYWWVDSGCVVQSQSQQDLRLFPVSSTETASADPSTYLLTIHDIAWKSVKYSQLDADGWSPRVRMPIAAFDPGRLTVQLDSTNLTAGGDLCHVSGFSELCQRNQQTRRRLFTVLEDPDADPSWPEARRRAAAEGQCLKLLNAHAPKACAEAPLWGRRLAGELVAGFQGDIVVSESPRIVEQWQVDRVVWQMENLTDLAAIAELKLELLDGNSVVVDIQKPEVSSASPSGKTWFPASLALLATLLSIVALARTFRSSGPGATLDRKEVKLLVGEALNRHFSKSAGKMPTAESQSSDAIHNAIQALEDRVMALERELQNENHSVPPANPPPTDAISADPPPADTISTDAIPEIVQGPLQTLCQEIQDLDIEQGGRVSEALVAVGDLGYWIEILWSALREAAGVHLSTIADSLPAPAAEEWSRSRVALEDFASHDASALRWLSRGISGGEAVPSSELAFLQSTGLLDPEPNLLERLKRYLTPFDQPGRLGELILALQYLVEAYPVEHLTQDQRSRLRQEFSQAVRSIRLDEDFHQLVARVSAGVGLDYLPVPLYKSRLDQSDFSFVRQQASPISLTDRVGFEAKTGSSVIVRLERPFFVQSLNKVYYSGHAHVARD